VQDRAMIGMRGLPVVRDHGEELRMTTPHLTTEATAQPPIVLSADDYERLSALAHAASARMPEVADRLADEIGRAQVLAKGERQPDVVCMNSQVEFRDDTTGKVHVVTLVYPEAADISQRKISVLTPVGTALVGLRAGHSIRWEGRDGDLRSLTVLSVRGPQPTDLRCEISAA
jgi:regulator of nucleoside diphosphate kinase